MLLLLLLLMKVNLPISFHPFISPCHNKRIINSEQNRAVKSRNGMSSGSGIKLAPISGSLVPSTHKTHSKHPDSMQTVLPPSALSTSPGPLLSPDEGIHGSDKYSVDSGIVSVNNSLPTTPSPSSSARNSFSSTNKLPCIGTSPITLQFPSTTVRPQSQTSTLTRDDNRKSISLSAKRRQQFRQMEEGRRSVDEPECMMKTPNTTNTSIILKDKVPLDIATRATKESSNANIVKRDTDYTNTSQKGAYSFSVEFGIAPRICNMSYSKQIQ